MKKVLNIVLYVIIFLLVALICVLSIKKFFYNKISEKLSDVYSYNYVTKLVSFNELVAYEEHSEIVFTENVESTEIVEEIEEEENFEIDTKEESNIVVEQSEPLIEEIIPFPEDNVLIDNNILFDGLVESDLILKLEKNLKNELSGTAINFVEYYKATGLDPYLAVAIVLHETGCTWKCSNLVKQCYNYGGMKGGENKYNNTRYTCYSSKEEGINAYLNMLYNNYYAKGLTTAELINPKYAASLEWSVKINNYIDKIKNS